VSQVDQLLARVKGFGGSLTTRQLVSLALAFVAVVGLVSGTAFWVSRPTYTLLFEDMDQAALAEVVSRLDAQKVDYELVPGGRGVRVPSSQVDRLRIDFSAEGLPSSGRIGFEIFDRTAFGQTEFLEHVNYRRALEGEIARTIASISEVSSARLHIAMARDSLFGAREQPAKASVILKLRNPSRPLAPATVAGITNLVAASVEGLRPESVVVMDSYGRPLARPPAGDDAPLGAAQQERQRSLEREMSERLVAMLEPVAGPDRVRVNVSMRLSAASEERTEEKWDPNTSVIRSRQLTTDGTPGSVVGAVAGARANLPAPAGPEGAPPATPPAPVLTASGRSSETTNYEISRTTTHTVKPSGDVARLSVAVILDDDVIQKKEADGTTTAARQSRKPEELQKIHGLVAAAVGLDTTRGDQLTVENIAFDAGPTEPLEEPGIIQRYGPVAGEGAKVVGVLMLVGLAILMVIRPVVQAALAGARPLPAGMPGAVPQGALPRSVEDMEQEIEAQLAAAAGAKQLETVKMPLLTKKANAMVSNEPENAARMLRAWLAEGER
jgi:flagellar M-ring protein FliF